MTAPVELLRRLQVSLVSGYMPGDVAKWLSQGIEAYLDGRRLESALGLKSAQGKNGPATVLRLQRRDELVRRLVRGLTGSAWEQAGTLEKIICGFDPKAPYRTMQGTYLAEAHRLGFDIPRSQAQLYRILAGRRD